MKITLCGSTRFRSEFEKWNRDLTLAGHLVYSLGAFGKQGSDVGKPDENETFDEQQKMVLDLVHLQKIEESDAILVLNVNGYVGFSTTREIEWATQRKKKVYCLNTVGVDAPEPWIKDAASRLLGDYAFAAEELVYYAR